MYWHMQGLEVVNILVKNFTNIENQKADSKILLSYLNHNCSHIPHVSLQQAVAHV